MYISSENIKLWEKIKMIGLAFFVYRRPEHTRKVIDSIRRNNFEKIYIFQDGLKNEKDREKWEEVTALISNIDFTETEIHISEENKGIADSVISGMNYVFERHDMAIALEDDVVLADGFKSLVETLFEKYKDNKKVMSICGGGYGAVIPKEYKYDVYFSYRMSSFAFGTWKDRWSGFERNPMLLKEIYSDPQKSEMLKYAGNDVEIMLFESLQKKKDTWATYWILYQINQLGFHVIPSNGYVEPIGQDGSGTNTICETSRYNIEMNGEKKEVYELPDDIIIDDAITQDTVDLYNVAHNKFLSYFDVLCMWMKIYQNKLSTLKYFTDNNIFEIYIYGMGKLADFLYHDIVPEIKIAGYVVENKRVDEYNERKVYDMREYDGMSNIPIVITPSYDIALIKHFFRKCDIKNKIILIDDVVKYVLVGK